MQQATRVHSDATPSTSPEYLSEMPAKLTHFAQAIITFERHEVETIVERLIAMLDHADGDPNLEDGDADYCPAGDDGCGIFWIGGRSYWGAEAEA
ncbi:MULTISPECIES: hypothetical protein [unclassified Sphingomonas]|uniref:hypothetical protein n=1 Tax=Sphingomonas sp. PvP015 TaxID=3156388 RepID=UPI003398EA7D